MMDWLEIFGYFGSVLVAISLMMANIKKLRWINLFGAFVFTIYGFLIQAYPVMLLNGWICITNIYFLRKIYQFNDQFDTLYFPAGSNPLTDVLTGAYKNDIELFFPEYNHSWRKNPTIVIMRNLKPVGLFIMTPVKDGQSEVLVDYATPEVRDNRNTQFLFESRLDFLKGLGIEKLTAKSNNTIHQKFLTKVGFTSQDNMQFERSL